MDNQGQEVTLDGFMIIQGVQEMQIVNLPELSLAKLTRASIRRGATPWSSSFPLSADLINLHFKRGAKRYAYFCIQIRLKFNQR